MAIKMQPVTPPPVIAIKPLFTNNATPGPQDVPEEPPVPVEKPKAPEPEKELTVVPKKAEAAPKSKLTETAALIAAIRKEKGDKIIYKGSEVPDVIRLPTGDFEFDFATGGGFPRGRIAIIYGPESSCKTTLALRAIAVAQKGPEECNKAIFVDVEHAFDRQRAEEVGVDVDALIVIKPGFGEEASDLAAGFTCADDVAIVVIDSLAALISSAEIDKSAEKFDVGTSAILIKRMCNKINIHLSQEFKRNHIPAIILINQIRFKVGVVFGNPETTPGGKTPHFLSALTIRVKGTNKTVAAVNADMPSFKTLDCEIIKAKVGIIRSKFAMDMAMIAHGDLLAGETASWNMVKNELQAAGLLYEPKKGKGWHLDGKIYPVLSMIEDTYYAEQDFAIHLQQMVIATYKDKKTVFDNTKEYVNLDSEHTTEQQPGAAPTNMMFQGAGK